MDNYTTCESRRDGWYSNRHSERGSHCDGLHDYTIMTMLGSGRLKCATGIVSSALIDSVSCHSLSG